MSVKEIFKKQGGLKLLKQYLRTGALWTAVAEFIMLGKSNTALEILRLSAQFKTLNYLRRKYGRIIDDVDTLYDSSIRHENSNKIWVCWFQGLDEAPEIVRICYDSFQKIGKEVVLITEDNYREYVTFPRYIQEKIDSGIIGRAHAADLLRLELLLKYGGTWLDLTILYTGGYIPDYMMNSELFMFQCMKPGINGKSISVSNWYISAYSNNRLLFLTRELLYKYWKDNNDLVDYFIFHYFFQLAIEKHPEEWKKVVPFSNEIPHIILLRLFDKFDERVWDAVTDMTPFSKLSYKLDENNKKKHDTYYMHIKDNYY